jgi:tetratricopeptide (TPR) repeat protein
MSRRHARPRRAGTSVVAANRRGDVRADVPSGISSHLARVALLLVVASLAFLPVLKNDFVNWDDPFTLQNNARLGSAGVVGWALTTFEMGHYQPLPWLTWSAVKALFGLDPGAFHALSLLGHLLNASLVYFVVVTLVSAAGIDTRSTRTAALLASLVFAVHPLQVEVVAWASAFPYVLSLGLTLTALLAYLEYCGRMEVGWLIFSIAAYVLSLASRANALLFPVVLLVLDIYPLRRNSDYSIGTVDSQRPTRTRATWRRLVLEKSPFIAAAGCAAIIEWRARDVATFEEISLLTRLTMAATAPFRYLGRTVLPLRLTPIDPLPLAPRTEWLSLALVVVALVAVTVVAWTVRNRWPVVLVCWGAYLLLLIPVLGLTPSGQQATADRYMYLPQVVVSLATGIAVAPLLRRRWASVPLLVVLTFLVGITWRQIGWWHDSITLWTRALDLDPANDVASYNLAIALSNAGKSAAAIERYDQTLRLVPDHEPARQNRNQLVIQQAEHDGDQFAESGRLNEAIDAYSRALAIDDTLRHARAARGIALSRSGRFAEAIADLQGAVSQSADPGIVDALAFALARTGQLAEAVDALKKGLASHPDDLELSHNLARLLATAPDPGVRDPAQALRLAAAIRDRTNGRDPRVLDTLAAAYAAAGQRDAARRTADQAAEVARELGERELADEIRLHARSYGP